MPWRYVLMRRISDVDDAVQQQQCGALVFLWRVKGHGAGYIVYPYAGDARGNSHGSTKLLEAGSYIQRMQSMHF